jgi:hypothetical protein
MNKGTTTSIVLYEVRKVNEACGGGGATDAMEAVPSKDEETMVVFVVGAIGEEDVSLRRLTLVVKVHAESSYERYFFE